MAPHSVLRASRMSASVGRALVTPPHVFHYREEAEEESLRWARCGGPGYEVHTTGCGFGPRKRILSLSVSVSLTLSAWPLICLSVYLSVYLSGCSSVFVYLSRWQYVCLGVHLRLSPCFYLEVYPLVYLLVSASMYLSVSPSVRACTMHLSSYLFFLSVRLSACPLICQPLHLSMCIRSSLGLGWF